MTAQTNFRLSEDTLAKIDDLARIYGPVVSLTKTDVIRVLVDEAHKEATKNTRKKLPQAGLTPNK